MNKVVITILQRVLINHFYKMNAGFFLFGFFVIYGVVAPGQLISYHLSLIQGMIQSPEFLGFVIVLWFLYTLKCINYTVKQLNEPRQFFLFSLHTLSNKQQFIYLLYVHLLIYMPVLLYAITVTVIAAKQHFYWATIEIIISNISMILLATFTYRFSLQKKEFFISKFLPQIHFPFHKPLFFMPLWFIWIRRKQMLFITKLFSLLLLYGFINLYEPEQHDIRPLLLIVLLTGMAHCTLVLQIRLFKEAFLPFSRNLPIPVIKRFGSLLLLFVLLLLPELVLVWKAFPLHFRVSDFPQLLLLAISLPAFFYSILLMNEMDAGSYFRIVFGTGTVLFFLILYNPGMLLPVFLTGISFVLFSFHFYTFEKRFS